MSQNTAPSTISSSNSLATPVPHSDAPIRSRPLHDAHVLALLMVFFIGVALPVPWHTVVALSLVAAVLAWAQGMELRAIVLRLGIALLLSWSVWLWNLLFVDVRNAETLHTANRILLRVTTMTWVALMSGKMLNLRDVVSYALQRGWLSMNIAYALQLGFGSIELMRAEVRRIMLSASLRGLRWNQRFLQWLPILIFALRHATKGAMSLRARGLRVDSAHKTFYYNYQSTHAQIIHLCWAVLACVIVIMLSLYFR